jgi:hypothetical protein
MMRRSFRSRGCGKARAVGARGAIAAAAATALVLPPAADAAFPGRDGLIAFTRAVGSKPGQIYLVRPNGHGLRRLPHPRRGLGRIWTLASDGSGLRQLTHGRSGVNDWDHSWQPR